MQKFTAEFIGTFFLVLTIGMAVAHAGDLAPLAVGLSLMAMVYAGGHISGAHYNPAVTLAMWMRGTCPARDIPGYVMAQLVGAVAAALVVMFFSGGRSENAIELAFMPALLAEALFTFALVYVILNVATAKATEGNDSYGLAIGAIVSGGAYAMGTISSAAFNPAVAIGLIVMGLVSAADIWIYLLANFGAAALAAVVFKLMQTKDEDANSA